MRPGLTRVEKLSGPSAVPMTHMGCLPRSKSDVPKVITCCSLTALGLFQGFRTSQCTTPPQACLECRNFQEPPVRFHVSRTRIVLSMQLLQVQAHFGGSFGAATLLLTTFSTVYSGADLRMSKQMHSASKTVVPQKAEGSNSCRHQNLCFGALCRPLVLPFQPCLRFYSHWHSRRSI